MACHNLCDTLKPPPGFNSLLGLGLKFCIETRKLTKNPSYTIQKLRHSIRLKAWINKRANTDEQRDETYIPALYVTSTFKPPLAPGDIEYRIEDFSNLIEIHVNNRPASTNLTRLQYTCLRSLKADTRFIICMTDKNLGPAIIERDRYIERCLRDHLFHAETYQQLTPTDALQQMLDTTKRLRYLRETHESQLSTAEQEYFKRSFQPNMNRKIPQFYITFKVHKQPTATRPIVSCVGSALNVYSKWLDYHMKMLVEQVPTYLRDSNQLLQETTSLGPLPQGSKIFTADAVSMYTNINSEDGIRVISEWIRIYQDDLPENFPSELFIDVLKIVMENNIFQFDDTYWLQRQGTAMGTSCACTYATLYWGFYERLYILPKWQHALPFLRRFIDDKFGIWHGTNTEWENFKTDLNNCCNLRWTTEEPTDEVTFLDLTIYIGKDQRLKTRTFQKPTNLHLYIPPTSAHPPGVLKSIIYGNLRRYWLQNNSTQDYIAIVKQFADRLIARGHNQDTIKGLFKSSARTISQQQDRREDVKTTSDNKDTLYLHREWHPRDIARSKLRQFYESTLRGHDGFNQLRIAYSRPRNLRDSLMKTQLSEPPGSNISDMIEKLKPSQSVTEQP